MLGAPMIAGANRCPDTDRYRRTRGEVVHGVQADAGRRSAPPVTSSSERIQPTVDSDERNDGGDGDRDTACDKSDDDADGQQRAEPVAEIEVQRR